jgi:hypothetical protein
VIRSSKHVMAARAALPDEMAAGDLGDARLNARRNQVVRILAQRPDCGFPEACGDDSRTEALYRFLRNRRISLERVLEPHVQATAERCRAVGEVLVIHDTTEFNFPGEKARAGLTVVGPDRHAFWMHSALAVSADGRRAPLGVVAAASFVKKDRGQGAPDVSWRARFRDPAKQSARWRDGVTTVRARLGPGVRAIHLMDREGDSYELFAALRQQGESFIIRIHYDRRLDTAASLHDVIPTTEWIAERTVALAPRDVRHKAKPAHQRHPARAARSATLRMAARTVMLPRPQQCGRGVPPTLTLNLVYVWEAHPPVGAAPIEWRLLTTAAIDTPAAVEQIVDWYRTRWLIEEFFKCLKTGCAYERRQLESLQTLRVALGLFVPIAWQLLLLRHLAREHADAQADAVLTTRHLHLLRVASTRPLSSRPTVGEVLIAIARLGGHLRQNGEPGWLVLARGMQTLYAMAAGWNAAERARSDQS